MSQQAALNTTDFSFLDLKEFKDRYAGGSQLNEMRLYIGGIRCSKCVRKLEDLPLHTPGLRRLEVEMGTHLAHLEVDPEVLSLASATEKIAALGFDPIPLRRGQDLGEVERQEDRRDVIRLGVAGACAGNIMTFAFANYLGATVGWAPLFAWLSFILYLPVVTYVALPFYKGAWQSLKLRQISIDMPMTVASLSGFGFSTMELVRGRSDIYFDSLSGFLFLILISRFLQKRLQRSFLHSNELTEGLQLQNVRRVDHLGWTWRPLELTGPGERILVHAPELVPVEAELLSSKASFSLAWLTGESKSKTFLRGATIPAGSRLVSGEAQLCIRKMLSETTFGHILAEVQRFSLSRNRMVSISDRWAQRLLATVFSIGLLFLLFYWHISSEEAIRRSLALIILACPCAMAFGTPLALASALRRSRRQGLIIRNSNVFESANEVKTIFFDKTGTLTDSELSLIGSGIDTPHVFQKIILSLENESLHPIAFAFRNAFAGVDQIPPVEGFKEVAGRGVEGFIYGRFYQLRNQQSSSTDITCSLFEDERCLKVFHFQARLKPGCRDLLDTLRSRGYKVRLLSGDQREVVESTSKFLGFASDEFQAGLSPDDKAKIVARTPNAMMVGDGINDSLALMRAHVAVAVSGGVETALKSAQVYLGEAGLSGIVRLFDNSRDTARLIRRNLGVSLIYNVCGGTLALMGFINPLAAALLMPVSSGFILLSTWLGERK